jgi:glycosyltransferase involved in cell wall biosynthesis
LFVGDGHLRPQLEEKAKWESIKFLGFRNQSQMPAIYDLCDIFVLPSGFEPWGLAINEAMNASKAVIVSDQVGCACDLIVQKENGYIYPAGDISALTQALNWGLANYQKAGQISKQKIQNWSYQQDIQGLKQALEYLVNK